MHLNWLGPLGGSLFGTLPNPGLSADAFVEAQVFGRRPAFTFSPGSAAGSNTQIQYNNAGQFGASANLTFNGTTLSTAGLNNTGDTILGDASPDALTTNFGILTLNNDIAATRTNGTLATGTTVALQFTETFTGDSGGASVHRFAVIDSGNSGSNNVSSQSALRTIGRTTSGSAVGTLRGQLSEFSHGGTALVTNAYAIDVDGSVASSGNITTVALINVGAITYGSTGAVTNAKGVQVSNFSSATLTTNAFGFDCLNLTGALTLTAGFRSRLTSGTGKWNVYADGTANNALAGNVRIGSVVAPTVALDVTGAALISATLGVTGNFAVNTNKFDVTATTGAVAHIGGVTTSGALGAVAVVASGRSTAQTAAVTSVSTFTVGGSDGSFEVSVNVNVTTSTLHNFTVTCAYTDETNTARTVTLGLIQLAGATLITAITNVTGAGPYEGFPVHLRCKASTAITVATVGTFTTVTYNAEGIIKQTA